MSNPQSLKPTSPPPPSLPTTTTLYFYCTFLGRWVQDNDIERCEMRTLKFSEREERARGRRIGHEYNDHEHNEYDLQGKTWDVSDEMTLKLMREEGADVREGGGDAGGVGALLGGVGFGGFGGLGIQQTGNNSVRQVYGYSAGAGGGHDSISRKVYSDGTGTDSVRRTHGLGIDGAVGHDSVRRHHNLPTGGDSVRRTYNNGEYNDNSDDETVATAAFERCAYCSMERTD